ncbi:MAG: hypothetical protein U0P81_10290 [Holophagaceae bacterium]
MPPAAPRSSADPRRFYTVVAFGLLLVVFAGFFRTYFFAPLFYKDTLPLVVHAHGAVMTAWYLLFMVQVRLAASRRLSLHRTLGLASLALASLVVVLGTLVSLKLAGDRLRHDPASPEGPFLLGIQLFAILVPFVVLYGAGLLTRRKPEVHRRLMALAMFSTLGPAVVRLPFIPNHNIPLGIGVTLGILLSYVAADVVASRKLHKATLLGAALIITATFAGAAFSGTSPWIGLVRRLML